MYIFQFFIIGLLSQLSILFAIDETLSQKLIDASFSMVYVHLGEKLPKHLEISLKQARLFNSECPIILIANQEALDEYISPLNITKVACESLPLTKAHQDYNQKTCWKMASAHVNWRYPSERFLYLHDFMTAYEVKNVFHLENDVLIYVDLNELFPIFCAVYSGIATTFESSSKCIPGFVYLSNHHVMHQLASYFVKYASRGITDMQLFAIFRKEKKDIIDCLPMIMESFIYEYTSSSFENRLVIKKLGYCNHIKLFQSIFDGAAIGVYFDGIDPLKGGNYTIRQPFDPSLLNYEWLQDNKGRWVPFAIYQDERYRINNLHIASKRLERFTSIDN